MSWWRSRSCGPHSTPSSKLSSWLPTTQTSNQPLRSPSAMASPRSRLPAGAAHVCFARVVYASGTLPSTQPTWTRPETDSTTHHPGHEIAEPAEAGSSMCPSSAIGLSVCLGQRVRKKPPPRWWRQGDQVARPGAPTTRVEGCSSPSAISAMSAEHPSRAALKIELAWLRGAIETTTETIGVGHDVGHERLGWSEVVARGGVEPPTFRFSVQSPPDRSRTTWHFACRGCVVEAPEAPRRPELLDSSLDTAPPDARSFSAFPDSLQVLNPCYELPG